MSATFRAATFNMENLFNRARVLNLLDNDKVTALLGEVARLKALLAKSVYTEAVKQDILELSTSLGDYVEIREDRGKLFTGSGSKRRVSASGAGDWDGVVVFRRARVPEMARESTAAVVKALNADVLCAVEVEDRPVLRDFNSEMLGSKKFSYPMLLDGNDPRGIDVGILTKLDIVDITTHIFDKDGQGAVFSRDCLEVELRFPDGRPLFFLCNHLKSQGFGSKAANDAKRLRQAKRIVEILAKYDLAKDRVIVAGDMNDRPDSPALAPLLSVPNLFDVLELQFPNPADRWTYKYGRQLEQIDFLLVSKPLKEAFRNATIERRGIYDIQALTGQTSFPSVTTPTTAASDHCAIVAEFGI